MKYRVLRIYDDTAFLIGHYETMARARAAATDDLYDHKRFESELSYNITPVEIEMSQAEVSEFFKLRKREILGN